MSNKVFYINYDDPVRATRDYDPGVFDEFEGETPDCLRSRYKKLVMALPVAGTYIGLTQDFRPEIASYDIYGTVKLWDTLLDYNRIISFSQLKVGQKLVFPSFQDIETIRYNLISKRKGY